MCPRSVGFAAPALLACYRRDARIRLLRVSGLTVRKIAFQMLIFTAVGLQIRPSGLLLLLGLDALHLLRAVVLDSDRRACFQAGEGQRLILAFAGLALPV